MGERRGLARRPHQEFRSRAEGTSFPLDESVSPRYTLALQTGEGR